MRIHLATRNRKLAPVIQTKTSGRPRPQPLGPYMVATYVSIAATCPTTCRFRDGACYVLAGFTARANRLLDEGAKGMVGREVIAREVEVLDGLFPQNGGRVPQDGGRDGRSGRDLRLHVGGDTPDTHSAMALANMAERWAERGGGAVFTYTHNWRRIPRDAWGTISVLASVERWAEAREARERGYTPAMVVQEHASDRAEWVPDAGAHIIPCPAETRGTTCVKCRLCLDESALMRRERAISFAVHGRQKHKLRVVP